MKKFLSILMLFAILLSVCACGAEEPAQQETTTAPTEGPATEATEPESKPSTGVHTPTPEELYGHINQLEPVDGVYKIWNAEGVKNIINHPDGKFELLCTIDMEGAVLAPIGAGEKAFTGELKGSNFFIKNFTVQGGDEENFGFIGVNQGAIRNLVLENVTFVPGANAKNIGSLAGDNQGEILRCNVNSSTMTVETAPEGANCGAVVGLNSGSLANGIFWVDLAYNAAGAANVGGIVGLSNGGTIEYLETDGKLEIAGTNKNCGLFAGQANDVILKNCVFVGETNLANGEQFRNFTGNPDDDELVVAEKALRRDNDIPPLTEGQAKLRDRVVEEMYKICTVPWRVRQDLPHTCYCSLSGCHGTYNTSYQYLGIPYNHKGGSLDRFLYCFDEEGYAKSWVHDLPSFDGYDAYIGNDCSTAVLHAYLTVSNSVDFMRVRYEQPMFYDIGGCLAVGGYNYDFTQSDSDYTDKYWLYNTEEEMLEAYACIRRGDIIANMIEAGGHTRMAATDAVVVRDQQGKVNPTYSYILTHEQGSSTVDDVNMTYSTCKVNYKRSFDNLQGDWYIPVTCEELLTGEMETPECTISQDLPGKAGLTTGYIKANYFLDSVTLKITDSQGQEVFNHKMFTTAARRAETSDNDQIMRNYKDDYDMAYFATPLSKTQLEPGETYTYTITARLGTYDEFLLKEDTFVNG